jgi:hypothetical protein
MPFRNFPTHMSEIKADSEFVLQQCSCNYPQNQDSVLKENRNILNL